MKILISPNFDEFLELAHTSRFPVESNDGKLSIPLLLNVIYKKLVNCTLRGSEPLGRTCCKFSPLSSTANKLKALRLYDAWFELNTILRASFSYVGYRFEPSSFMIGLSPVPFRWIVKIVVESSDTRLCLNEFYKQTKSVTPQKFSVFFFFARRSRFCCVKNDFRIVQKCRGTFITERIR